MREPKPPTPEQINARDGGHQYEGRGRLCKTCALPKEADLHHPANYGFKASEHPAAKRPETMDQWMRATTDQIASLTKDVATLYRHVPGRAGIPERQRPLIHSAILEITRDIGPIAKRHLYQEQRADGQPGETFNFRLIDEMTAALQPLLVKHNVYITPRVIESWREKEVTLSGGVLFVTRVRVGFTPTSALDGTKADEGVTEGEAHSLSQFSTNAAQTMAYKQWVWMYFCVPVLNADDPENERDLPPVETVHTEPLTAAQEEAQLSLINDEPKQSRKKKTIGAVEQRIVPSEPLSTGSLNIIRAQMKGKAGLSEDMVAAHFNKTELSGLMQSQLGDVRDFINAWQPEGMES